MKKYKSILGILEKILFLILLIVVIVIASGYKYDPVKKELVQTGVLKIENMEDNTKLSFNNNSYDNKSNLSVSLLDQGKYDLNIAKDARKPYSTKVQINPGDVTYINPVLIPEELKPTLVQKNVQNLVYTDNAVFYTYTENNILYLERFSLNKTLFSVDISQSRIDITSVITSTDPINIYVSKGNNFGVILNGAKVILADYNKLTALDITSSLPAEKISSLEVVNNYILLHTAQNLYSVNISDSQKITNSLIYSGTNFLYDLNDNDQIIIFNIDENGQNIIEYYNFSGVVQNKLAFTTSIKTITDKTDFVYFYKNLYVFQNSTLYKLTDDDFVKFLENVQTYSKIDINNLLVITNEKSYVISHERMLVYDFTKSDSLQTIQVLPDLFTFMYTDKTNNLHFADFGGQDNIIASNLDTNDFISAQNGSDTYIAYHLNGQIEYIRLGNTKN